MTPSTSPQLQVIPVGGMGEIGKNLRQAPDLYQYAPDPRTTTRTVRARITRSSHSDQLRT